MAPQSKLGHCCRLTPAELTSTSGRLATGRRGDVLFIRNLSNLRTTNKMTSITWGFLKTVYHHLQIQRRGARLGVTGKTLTAVTARRSAPFCCSHQTGRGPSPQAGRRREFNYRPVLLMGEDFKRSRCHLTPAWTDRLPPFVHLRLCWMTAAVSGRG